MMAAILLVNPVSLHAQQNGQQKWVNVPSGEVSIGALSKIIKSATGTDLFYSKDVLDSKEKIRLKGGRISLDNLLEEIAKEKKLSYTFKNGVYILRKKEAAAPAKNAAADNVYKIPAIRGEVKDSAGYPLSGVVVVAKKGGQRAISNDDGVFTLNGIAVNDMLQFNSAGYERREMKPDASGEMKVQLFSTMNELDGVVVTALGIKRQERALGYSVTTVSGAELTNALSNNWTDALTGKVAGLNILKSGGGPAGSSKIILRGENSFNSQDNAALIVVDGVVISNSSGKMTGTGSGNYLDADSPVDFGSTMADLNPEDIESISVLKGPGASALYGARGGNGAIIITTKQGASRQKGWGVNVNSNTALASINRWPDYQYEYGQGDRASDGDLYYSYGDSEDGARTYSSSSAWGPKFNGQMYYQYEPARYRLTAIPAGQATRTPWVPYKNNRKDFFKTAKTTTNSISLSGGNANTSVRLSYTNVYNSWIVPNTGYKRNTVAFQLTHKVNDKLSITSKINYSNRSSDNLPSTGYNNQTIMYFIRGITPNMDLNWFKDYWLPGQEGIAQRRPFSLQLDNPFLQAYDMLNKSSRNGVIGNVAATYRFNRHLSLMVRSAVDLMVEDRSQQKPKSTQKYADGMYREQDITTSEVNNDFLLKYDVGNDSKNKSDFSYSVSIGGSVMRNKYRRQEYRAEKLIYPNVYTLANSALALEARPYRTDFATNSLYGMATFAYKNLIYLDVTARRDWTSTLVNPLIKNVEPYFYPSVNVSAILSDAWKMPEAISFWKVRGSVAGIGNGGTTPYLTSYSYLPVTTSIGGLTNPTTIPEPFLKPLRSVSTEFGTDIRFFKNKLQFDISVYQNNTRGQIVQAPVDAASGYARLIMNAGEVRNRGIEIQASNVMLSSKTGLNWKMFGNYSLNRNKIVGVPNGSEQILANMVGSRVAVKAINGGSLGDMYGLGYLRSPDGQIVYRNGLPVRGDSLVYVGSSQAKWKFGFGNQFSYGRFMFNFLFDGQFGGKAYSLTHAVLAEEGKLKKTLPGRYNGIIGDGVMETSDGKYVKNTVVANNVGDYYAEHFNRDNVEANMFRTDFIKLREVRIDYAFAPKLVKKLRLQRATIGLYGRDLFVITEWPSFDPEFGSLDDGDIRAGAEVAQFPSTRSMGVSLNISF
ncbi:SusC/RagA family TonB-linked outer membrane protein [Filimonas effusa]|uniref:SusC/RagA family TonB-linked outer membrane protein n=2 Tax=Filimonas effusa TaxID=2508721 RepID=A0A4Q1DFC3_9BACT|nr:SusC/RagA family TonB-linked outer membrane protein [Filimonas effusa]